jgi:hypothetical protein
VGCGLWFLCRLAPGAEVAAADGQRSAGPGWSVETGSPDALCPDLGLTEAALERRLGTVVTPPGASFRVRYTIGHAPQGSPRDFVHLELFGPDGALQLSRELPLEGPCATMADVIALVIDGHFRGLPHDEPERPAEHSVAPAAPAVDAPDPAPTAAPPTALVTLPLVLGPELTARHPAGPVAGLRATVEIAPHLYLGAALGLDLRSRNEQLDAGAQVSARSASLQLQAGYGTRLGAVHTYLGPSLRFSLDRGSARGLPYEYAPGSRALFAPGLQAAALWRFHPRLALSLTSTLDWSIRDLSGRFVIDGREVLEPVGPEVGVGVGLAYALSP